MSEGTDAARAVRGYAAAHWPVWLRALLFFALATVAFLAGTLDDWVRILLGIAFVGIGLTFLADARARRNDTAPPPPTYPTGQYQLPEPEQPDAS